MLDKILTIVFSNRILAAIAGLVLLWLLISWVGGTGSDENVSADQSRLQQQQDDNMVSSIQPIADAAIAVDESSLESGTAPVIEIGTQSGLLNAPDNTDLHTRFKRALAAQQEGRADEAIIEYQRLINDYPRIPENYINLANLFGAKGDLAAARATLMDGIDANQKASALVQGLQSVHSALAANAYRKALDVTIQEPSTTAIALPVVLELQTQLDLQDQVQRLQTSLSAQAESSAGSKELVADYSQQIQSLNNQLTAEKQNALSADAVKTDQINTLTQRLTQTSENLAATQAAEREALARVVRAEQNAKVQIEQANKEVVALKAELEQQQAALAAAREQQDEQQVALTTALREQEEQKQALLTAQQQQQAALAAARKQQDEQQAALSAALREREEQKQALLAAQREQENTQLALAATRREQEQQASLLAAREKEQQSIEKQRLEAQNTEKELLAAAREKERQQQLANEREQVSVPSVSEVQKQQAIDRVKSWAQAWSDQNVDAYVSQYIDTYKSQSAGSREVWLDQRRVRLTNKKFIRVEVSNFTVLDLGDRYSVTFRQHYKSDVIDDVIFKRLTFTKQGGGDWSNAKIVGERVVNPS